LTLLQGLLLGLVQGLTEFLPISSSGHLVLAQAVLAIDSPGVLIEVVTHAGTLLAILLWFRRRLLALTRSLFALPRLRQATVAERRDLHLVARLAVGSVPAAAVGVLLNEPIEALFDHPSVALVCLCVTGLFLIATRWAPRSQASEARLPHVVAVGVAQALAILPGISRSGSTIGTALFLGIEGATAAELSFLLAIPAIGGALLLKLAGTGLAALSPPLAVAFVAAFGSGLVALRLLFRALARGSLWWYGTYCLVVGSAGLLFLALR